MFISPQGVFSRKSTSHFAALCICLIVQAMALTATAAAATSKSEANKIDSKPTKKSGAKGKALDAGSSDFAVLDWKNDLPGKAPGPALATIKQAADGKSWLKCASLSKDAYAKLKMNDPLELKPWVLLQWLKCAKHSDTDQQKLQELVAPLQEANNNPTYFAMGAARTPLLSERVVDELFAGELAWKINKNSKLAMEHWQTLLSFWDRVERDTRSKMFLDFSEVAQAQNQLQAVQQLLQQSLAEKAGKVARERLSSVQLALGSISGAVESPDTSNSDVGDTDTPEVIDNSPEHQQLVHLDLDYQNKDYLAYAEDGSTYLHNFPLGRRSKQVQDRILEAYSAINDRVLNKPDINEQAKWFDQRERILRAIERLDAIRVLDFARTLHRRADYAASLELAEKAQGGLSNSTLVSNALFVEGRSAQFLGQYITAQKNFEKYLEVAAGGDDVAEVNLRLGLTYFRLHQFSSTVAVLEKLLLSHKVDKYELSARYWLVRALQRENNPRAKEQIDILLQKFPLSYYGLRLLSERNNQHLGKAMLSKGSELHPPPFYLTKLQLRGLRRVDFLASQGWLQEAQKDFVDFSLPREASQKLQLAKQLADVSMYAPAIKLVSDATDADPNLRDLGLLDFAYPKVFNAAVDLGATKNGLNPILIRSLTRQESAFGMFAVSSSNAMGLMQLIPPTAQEVVQELHMNKVSLPDDAFLPDVNIAMGSYYLAKMIRKFNGYVPFGIAAYNVGPQKMQAFVQSRPEVASLALQVNADASKITDPSGDEIWMDEMPWYETSFYVKAVLRNSLIYKTLEQTDFQLQPILWSDLVASPVSAPSVSPVQSGPDGKSQDH